MPELSKKDFALQQERIKVLITTNEQIINENKQLREKLKQAEMSPAKYGAHNAGSFGTPRIGDKAAA